MRGLSPEEGASCFPLILLSLILEGKRMSLPCEVKPVEPVLGFDLGFHTGYRCGPASDFAEGDNNSRSCSV